MNVCVCWSGGKNSTRAIFEYLKLGHKVTAVCCIPMFDEEIPLIDDSHYQFILGTKVMLEKLGVSVVILKGVTYYDWCSRLLVKGKNRGLPRSFPCFIKGKCGFSRDGKIRSINKYFSFNADKFDFVDIGLCADEYDRKKLKGKERSILQELGITDYDCFLWCRSKNLLSPKYKDSKRDGCVLCPHAKRVERYRFFERYPQAIEKVKHLQRLSMQRGFYPLRGKHWFIEDKEFVCGNGSQLSCLGDMVFY